MLSLFGLVLLILLSPCKVRNYIQSELGIPHTNVTNKSQSTISQSTCQGFDISDTVQKVSKPAFQQFGFLNSEVFRLEMLFVPLFQPCFSSSSRKISTSVVPLYILYHNLKIYS